MRIFLFAFLCGMVFSAGAQARPRDEAMAGAYRCAGISATRVWLDCYYGAAQPVRASLGLPPAPAAQVQLALSPPQGGSANDSGTRDQVMAAAARCALSGDRDWLNCYYAAAIPARAALGLSVPVAAQPPPPLLTVPPPPRERRVPSTSVVDEVLGISGFHVVSRMAEYSFAPDGKFTVTLANGQVWRQMPSDTLAAHWRKPAGTYQVTVSGGAFGSYNLTVRDTSGRFKVRRVS